MPYVHWEGDLTLTDSDGARLRDFIWGDERAAAPQCVTNNWADVVDRDGNRAAATVTWGTDTMETSVDPDGIYYRPRIPYRNRAVRITWGMATDATGVPMPRYAWADLYMIDRIDWPRHDEGVRGDMGAIDVPFRHVPGVQPALDQCAAERRATELLMSVLEPAQRDMFRKEKTIIVVAASGTQYRIGLGTVNNIMELNPDGTPKLRLCVHPVGVPLADVLVTQKLLLETDEAEFRRMANISDPVTGRMVQRAAERPRSLQGVA